MKKQLTCTAVIRLNKNNTNAIKIWPFSMPETTSADTALQLLTKGIAIDPTIWTFTQEGPLSILLFLIINQHWMII